MVEINKHTLTAADLLQVMGKMTSDDLGPMTGSLVAIGIVRGVVADFNPHSGYILNEQRAEKLVVSLSEGHVENGVKGMIAKLETVLEESASSNGLKGSDGIFKEVAQKIGEKFLSLED